MLDLAWINPPKLNADIRQCPEHFKVNEVLPFPLTGNGEHTCLRITKRGQNSSWIVKLLAKIGNVKIRDIGYCGLKDRHAETTQWFSVYTVNRDDIDWQQIESEQIKIIDITRHVKKLRKGTAITNQFEILLLNIQENSQDLSDRMHDISKHGVANYFTEQRFGIGGNNLKQASRLFSGEIKARKDKKSLYLSAARSAVFNQVLEHRVRSGHWDKRLAGDVFMLAGSHSIFNDTPEQCERNEQRLKSFDIHVTGPLIGDGTNPSKDQVYQLETQIIAEHPVWKQGLIEHGLKFQRRALRVLPKNCHWQVEKNSFAVSFNLPSGSYATSILRELCYYHDVSKKVK